MPGASRASFEHDSWELRMRPLPAAVMQTADEGLKLVLALD
jgi:hypothetical protein